MSFILSKIEGGETELTERDLDQVTGGVVAGESTDKDHRDMGGSYSPPKPAKPSVAGSAWLGGKV
jgi:hypothetical protein